MNEQQDNLPHRGHTVRLVLIVVGSIALILIALTLWQQLTKHKNASVPPDKVISR